MSEEDEEKTSFYIDQGTLCYTKMSFGLKNASATYQRLVDSAFRAQLGRWRQEGKFLRYMVTSEGIRANPKKTKAVADMSAEWALPFYKTLKNITKENKDDYRWTEDAERSISSMKKLII
ncbi:hypothetical protein Tco_0884479 [Tanacetum coccineum]